MQDELEKNNIEFENGDEDTPIQTPAKYHVVWRPEDPSIFELHRQSQKGTIDVQPEFQRYYVWDDKKASRLIESVLLDLPIPVIYLAEETEGHFSVIDGQQRLTSFFRFLDNDLELRGLHVLQELEGKRYKDLDASFQTKIENSKVHTVMIKKESDPDIKFEIFERLNTGSVKLNDDELRNCLFKGNYIQLIKELAAEPSFQFLLGRTSPDKRMRDRGLVLQFFAFLRNSHYNYKQPMKQFLNRELREHQDLSSEAGKEQRAMFKQAVEFNKYVFGDKAFRRFVAGGERDPNGQWETRKINKALFDIVMFGFTKYSKPQIISRSDAIREELIHLMSDDREFIDSIRISTGNVSAIMIRFKKWLDALEKIIGYYTKEPRAFSLSLKEQLYKQDQTCKKCGQRIQVLDDAAVDHIEHYWRGGATIPSNARLLHRFCNQSRGGREDASITSVVTPTRDKQESRKENYTFDDHLSEKPPYIQNLFKELREKIKSLGDDVTEQPQKHYVAYSRNKNFVEIEIKKKALKLHIDLPIDRLNNPNNLGRDMRRIGHYGTGDTEVQISEARQISDIMNLIKQSYEVA